MPTGWASISSRGCDRPRKCGQPSSRPGAATRKLDAALRLGKTPDERRRLLDVAAGALIKQLDTQVPASPAQASPERKDNVRLLDDARREGWAAAVNGLSSIKDRARYEQAYGELLQRYFGA